MKPPRLPLGLNCNSVTTVTSVHTLSTAFRHLPPNPARFGYATEGALLISAQLSTDAVSALRKVRVLIRLWKPSLGEVLMTLSRADRNQICIHGIGKFLLGRSIATAILLEIFIAVLKREVEHSELDNRLLQISIAG